MKRWKVKKPKVVFRNRGKNVRGICVKAVVRSFHCSQNAIAKWNILYSYTLVYIRVYALYFEARSDSIHILQKLLLNGTFTVF